MFVASLTRRSKMLKQVTVVSPSVVEGMRRGLSLYALPTSTDNVQLLHGPRRWAYEIEKKVSTAFEWRLSTGIMWCRRHRGAQRVSERRDMPTAIASPAAAAAAP